jgi:hypothetical protein
MPRPPEHWKASAGAREWERKLATRASGADSFDLRLRRIVATATPRLCIIQSAARKRLFFLVCANPVLAPSKDTAWFFC